MPSNDTIRFCTRLLSIQRQVDSKYMFLTVHDRSPSSLGQYPNSSTPHKPPSTASTSIFKTLKPFSPTPTHPPTSQPLQQAKTKKPPRLSHPSCYTHEPSKPYLPRNLLKQYPPQKKNQSSKSVHTTHTPRLPSPPTHTRTASSHSLTHSPPPLLQKKKFKNRTSERLKTHRPQGRSQYNLLVRGPLTHTTGREPLPIPTHSPKYPTPPPTYP